MCRAIQFHTICILNTAEPDVAQFIPHTAPAPICIRGCARTRARARVSVNTRLGHCARELVKRRSGNEPSRSLSFLGFFSLARSAPSPRAKSPGGIESSVAQRRAPPSTFVAERLGLLCSLSRSSFLPPTPRFVFFCQSSPKLSQSDADFASNQPRRAMSLSASRWPENLNLILCPRAGSLSLSPSPARIFFDPSRLADFPTPGKVSARRGSM